MIGKNGVSSWEVLAHRIIWSFATLSLILTATRRWKTFWQSALRPRILLILSATTLLIAINYALAAKRAGDREEAKKVGRQIREATRNAENLQHVLAEIES